MPRDAGDPIGAGRRCQQGDRTTIAVTDQDGSSDVDNVVRIAEALHEKQPVSFLATCGSNRLLLLTQQLARAWDVPGQIALEQHMGCAMGMCFCCVREFAAAPGQQRYRRVCYEGPVFDVLEALPWSI